MFFFFGWCLRLFIEETIAGQSLALASVPALRPKPFPVTAKHIIIWCKITQLVFFCLLKRSSIPSICCRRAFTWCKKLSLFLRQGQGFIESGDPMLLVFAKTSSPQSKNLLCFTSFLDHLGLMSYHLPIIKRCKTYLAITIECKCSPFMGWFISLFLLLKMSGYQV